MANINKLKQRLKELEQGKRANEFAKLLWKPKEGPPQTVRIVPYKFNPDSPFIELKFYYNLAGKGHFLAPCTFGLKDPVLEYVQELRSSGGSAEKALAQKLSPTDRIYVPIIVRGEEDKGVRYWGFGLTVYKLLLGLIDDENWGDITSLVDGNDIKIEFHKTSNKKNMKTGEFFPETIIKPVPKKTPAIDPNNKELMAKLSDQTDIKQVFQLKTYDELKAIIDEWLNPVDSAANPTADVGDSVEASVSAEPTPKMDEAAVAAKFDEYFKTS